MNAPKTPLVTVGLVFLNILAAFLMQLVWPGWLDSGGFRANHPSLLTALTSLFLHVNVFHLLGNMVALLAIGAWVEDALGWRRYLLLYLVGGLFGVLVHWMAARGSNVILIGASGCVASCVAYGSIRYWWSKVSFGPRLKAPVAAVAGVWILLQLIGGFVKLTDEGGVSFWAHLGGVVAGFCFAAVWSAPKEASRHRGRKSILEMDQRSPAAVATAAREHLKSHPTDSIAFLELAEALEQLGDVEEEVAVRRSMIEQEPHLDQPTNAIRLAELGALESIQSWKRCKWAEMLQKSTPEASVVLLKSVIEGPDDDPQKPDALFALAQLLPDPDQAKKLLEKLRTQFPLHAATEVARAKGLLP